MQSGLHRAHQGDADDRSAFEDAWVTEQSTVTASQPSCSARRICLMMSTRLSRFGNMKAASDARLRWGT
jgi:hypothetical protein